MSSFQYLLMSSHFGNYEAHREGFKALYRKLSDKSWEDTISVLKYLGKRGGKANFNQFPHNVDVSRLVFLITRFCYMKVRYGAAC